MSCPSSSFIIPIQYVKMLCNSCDFNACRSFVGVLFFSWRCGNRCFAAVATLRNLERVGTSCQSTASHGQRPVTPCAISLDLLIVSLACHKQPLFSQQFGGTKKSNFDRAGLAFRVDVCSHIWRSFLSHWRNHQLTKWYLLSTMAAYIGE